MHTPKTHRRRVALAALSCLAIAPLVFARPANADQWALLIGIDQYDDTNHIASLGGAAADARALARTLQDSMRFPEDHVKVLVSDGAVKPTRTNILKEIQLLSKNARPGDTVFVLYSGHGIDVNGTPYLLPYDTSALDDETITDTALETSKFRARLRQVQAKALILAFDMCRSDPRKTGKDVTAADNKLTHSLARGLDFKQTEGDNNGGAGTSSPISVTLYSCTEGERSYEWQDKGRGYFSYYLEEGLKGAAADASGRVTIGALAQYVETHVKTEVQNEERHTQTPYPSLDGPGAADFVIANAPIAVVTSHMVQISTDGSTTQALRSQLAAALFKGKDYAGAIVQYNTILDVNPDDTAALFNRGVTEGLSGDNAKAAADFHAYTVKMPMDPIGFSQLGVYLAHQSDWKGASAAFSEDINLKPDDIEAYKFRGQVEYNFMDYKNSLADIKKYDAARPNDPDVVKLLPDLYDKLGLNSETEAALIATTKSNPTDSDAWLDLGIAQLKEKKYVEAVESLTKSIDLQRSEVALYDRAFAYYNLGQAGNTAAYPKVFADATSALEIKPNYPDAQLLKADAENSSKQFEAAKADYVKYASMDGITADQKSYALAQALTDAISLKDYAGVISMTDAMIAANPSEPSSYLTQGQAYVAMMNYSMAIPVLDKYLGMNSDDASGFYALGVAYAGNKDTTNAALAFEKSLTLKPNNFDAANQGAIAYLAQADLVKNDGDKAGPLYDKAIALFDRAFTIRGTGKEAFDALFNEATALESKARSIDSKDPKKIAITVWERWIAMATTDPDLPKVKTHVEQLKADVAAE